MLDASGGWANPAMAIIPSKQHTDRETSAHKETWSAHKCSLKK